jgi:hypothetical protein
MLAVNRIYNMDCLEGMRQMDDGSVDCCVTDPPYGIGFMGMKWDYAIPSVEIWKEVLRVLKPGAHLLVACGTRTQHRMAVNIEDAGFEIRDVITWHYGSGFPKSLDISKAIDKQAGAERKIIDSRIGKGIDLQSSKGCSVYGTGEKQVNIEIPVTEPSTTDAKKWEGWGTALKPATEFWTLARKPLTEKTVAANVMAYGTGALNIDSTRIHAIDAQGGSYTGGRLKPGATLYKTGGKWRADSSDRKAFTGAMKAGRFPPNLILDEFMAGVMDEQSGLLVSGMPMGQRKAENNIYGHYAPGQDISGYGDSGGASRFFYVAKPDVQERGLGNAHPTVKPLTLMHYLIKLVCVIEPGRILLEPFAGSGTTCIAARQLGIDFMAFELNSEYIRIADARMREVMGLFYDG